VPLTEAHAAVAIRDERALHRREMRVGRGVELSVLCRVAAPVLPVIISTRLVPFNVAGLLCSRSLSPRRATPALLR
jgi:hypothetical protein